MTRTCNSHGYGMKRPGLVQYDGLLQPRPFISMGLARLCRPHGCICKLGVRFVVFFMISGLVLGFCIRAADSETALLFEGFWPG